MGIHELCGRVHKDLTAQFFCAAARTWYQDERRPRRTRDEVVPAGVARAKAVAARREFHARKRAEQAARKAAKASVTT